MVQVGEGDKKLRTCVQGVSGVGLGDKTVLMRLSRSSVFNIQGLFFPFRIAFLTYATQSGLNYLSFNFLFAIDQLFHFLFFLKGKTRGFPDLGVFATKRVLKLRYFSYSSDRKDITSFVHSHVEGRQDLLWLFLSNMAAQRFSSGTGVGR